jgi:hypothetical protein
MRIPEIVSAEGLWQPMQYRESFDNRHWSKWAPLYTYSNDIDATPFMQVRILIAGKWVESAVQDMRRIARERLAQWWHLS